MAKKMLIDASHTEETRMVVVEGNRIEEFDFEAASRKQIAGNIYLAKVTRVEPSLQAAFVEYGGNRQGFLAFSEIHPDYYQIPIADREALLAAEAQKDAELEEELDAANDISEKDDEDDDSKSALLDGGKQSAQDPKTQEDEKDIEEVGSDDTREDLVTRKSYSRPYKIQEVIKRRQILLVQVDKEERGTKGAALTTYISLAGRYCVLMPNTGRGGGISRKISNGSDRQRLKAIANDMDIPEGMGLIIRTAGAKRTKAEIKRDYEYLLRQWSNIRDLTMSSIAPSLVHEEGNIVTRAIRDLYNKGIEIVLVEGENGYRAAKDYMKMLMPSHAKKVQHYREQIPLFTQYQVESQLAAMFNPEVQLKSGGYIVIGVTEALVSIDVNSGRATREHSIEETAYKTNLQAATEVARQLRLRDLAGLIVIDFIDMSTPAYNKAVERRLKDSLASDRARIQVGRISGFGLLEMSRQRQRPGMLESTTTSCPNCMGTGIIRSDDSLALAILRATEEKSVDNSGSSITVRAPIAVANYISNNKREAIPAIESCYGVNIILLADPSLQSPAYEVTFSAIDGKAKRENRKRPVGVSSGLAEQQTADEENKTSEDGSAPKKRRRRSRGGRKRRARNESADAAAKMSEPLSAEHDGEAETVSPAKDKKQKRKLDGKSNRANKGDAVDKNQESAKSEETTDKLSEEKPTRRRRKSTGNRKSETTLPNESTDTSSLASRAPETASTETAKDSDRPARKGWWTRVI